jgi:hypothetical protein
VNHDDDVVAQVLHSYDLELVTAARPRPGGDQIDLVAIEVDARQRNPASRIVPLEHVEQLDAVAEELAPDACELERARLSGEIRVRNVTRCGPATGE